MVRTALAALILLPFTATAATVNIEFKDVTLSELSQLYLKGFVKRDYVLAPEVLSDDRRVAISVKNKDEKELVPFFRAFMAQHDIDIQDKDGILFLTKRKPQEPTTSQTEPIIPARVPDPAPVPANAGAGEGAEPTPDLPLHIYRPRHRTVQQLADLVRYAGIDVAQNSPPDVLLFKADEEKAMMLTGILADLDKPEGELMVKAYLYEVSTNEKTQSGFNAALELLKGKLSINLASTNLANTLTLKFTDVSAVFSALDSDNRFKVISSPSLRVKNGKTSRFAVGSDVPVLGAITSYNNGQPVQSVTYRPSGVILEVKPNILLTSIDLDLNQQISNFVQTQTGVNDSPTLIKREISTTVSVQDGDLVLMGGLDESKSSQDKTGLSFLPAWMRARSGEESKTDILLVLHVQRI